MSTSSNVFTVGRVQIHGSKVNVRGMRDVDLIEGLCDRFMLAQEASGRSKAEFAESVGLTGPKLTNIKRYRNPPSHHAIAAAAQIYGLTTDFFYTGNLGGMRDQCMADKLRKLMERGSAI